MQKGFASILLLIPILILATIGGGYYFYKNQLNKTISQNDLNPPSLSDTWKNEKPLQSTPIPDETSNWKTYIAEEGNFSFKYPKEWIYEIKKKTFEIDGKKYNANLIVAGTPLTEKQRQEQGYININDAPKSYGNFSLFFLTSPDFKEFTLNDLYNKLILTSTIEENIDYNKEIVLNNISGKEVGYGCQAYCRDILFKHGNTIFDSSTGPNAELNIATLRQILSTFKFLDQE